MKTLSTMYARPNVGMIAADSELTKQLSSYTLLKNSIKFK